jgi:hypothetical protein
MIWVTGDLHGGVTAYHISSAVFKPAKRGDIVICTGDLGGVWWSDYHTSLKHRREEDYFLESKLRKKVLWLAVDGNHENFSRLFGGELSLVDLFGGKAYKIREHVYYLKRGEVFTIEGRTFLAFGGAQSSDKDPQPAFGPYDKVWIGRTEGVDWWPEEFPSEEDYENACRNLDKVGWKVDYVISHTCFVSQLAQFQNGSNKGSGDPTGAMLQRFVDKGLDFTSWHFGHFHWEQQVDRFVCHYNKVKPLLEPYGNSDR